MDEAFFDFMFSKRAMRLYYRLGLTSDSLWYIYANYLKYP